MRDIPSTHWKAMHTVPAVIPYFRNPAALEKNRAILAGQEGVAVELFVRDNSEDNILFTKAVNEGLRKFAFGGDAGYILVLNQDAYLGKDAVLQMVRVMEDNPRCGICTPVSLNGDGSVNWWGGLQAYPTGVHRTAATPQQLGDQPIESPWANGACLLLRVAMIREIGLLDENMRFAFSDSDYSFTARSRGWTVLVAPKALVEHSLGASGSFGTVWLESVKLQDHLYFSEKWLSGDVYKRLAVEGQRLSRMVLADEMRATRSALERLKAMPADARLG